MSTNNFISPYNMRCLMCFSSNNKLEIFKGDTVNDTFKRIKFVLPDFSIPETKDPVFVCTSCLDQVSLFYSIKKASLENCCRLKQLNVLLKGTDKFKRSELTVKINSDEVSTQPEHCIEIKVEPNIEDYFFSEDVDPTDVMTGNKLYDYNGQQLDYEESSNNSKNNTQNDSNDNVNKGNDCQETLVQRCDPVKKTRIRKKKKKTYKCSTCQRIFPQLFNLNRHQSTHREKDPNAKLNKSDDTKIKVKQTRVHTKKKKIYKCPTCEKMFSQLYNLNRHLHIHTDSNGLFKSQKLHQCTECPIIFKKRCDLVKHIRTHTGERPYKCPTCPKSFTQPFNLNRHLLTHTGEKPFQCDVCHKYFREKSNLKCHKRNHDDIKPFQCEVCGKRYNKLGTLSAHMAIHTGEKPFECHYCHYKCARESYLKIHIRIHTGDRPYACDHCVKSFVMKSQLKEHKRKIHNIEEIN